jgi:MFS transporter, AAHS family, 4-hydroxybenzoate transporter
VSSHSLFRVDVAKILSERRVGRFHLEFLAVCAVALFIAGYASRATVLAVPALAKEFHFTASAPGRIEALSAVAILLGMVVLAPLADRVGRRPVIVSAIALLGIASFGAMYAVGRVSVMAVSAVGGFAVGGIEPCVLALAVELMPEKRKITLTLLAWIGFPLGAALAAPIAADLTQQYSWRAIYGFDGVMIVVILPLLWLRLVDSPLLRAWRGDTAHAEIRTTLIRISRRYDFLRTTEFVSSERRERGAAPVLLFSGGRLLATLLVGLMAIAGFIAMADFALLAPAVLSGRAHLAALAAAMGIAGGFVVAPAADRLPRFLVLAAGFALGGLALAALGVAQMTPWAVAVAGIIASVFAAGTANAAVVVVAASYPTVVRATGAAFALVAGGVGVLAAPATLRALHALAGHPFVLDAALALPGLAAAAAAVIAWHGKGFGGEREAEPGAS